MRIYDISQELYGCEIWPGDPAPEKEILMSVENGDICNLSQFSACVHNGTHIDAPYHFFDNGKTVDELPLDVLIGKCIVAECSGELFAEDIIKLLDVTDEEAAKRLLIKGDAVVTAEAAKALAESRCLLIGTESQTVGPEEGPEEVHRLLLGSGKILLEGVRLAAVPEGIYILNAAPLNLSGADGSPCRAVLIEPEQNVPPARRKEENNV